MITYLYASLFDSPAQTLVNTVNTIGVMGKGIAKQFRESYPAMYKEYRNICDADELDVGRLHLWKDVNRWVLNFPTKTTWRLPSKIHYVEAGLKTFVDNYVNMGITSVSFPPLGCGNGNLDWEEVRPVMEAQLKSVHIPVYIHLVHVAEGFRAEHLDHVIPPGNFAEFWKDVRGAISANAGRFKTADGQSPFVVKVDAEKALHIRHESGKGELIRFEELETAWVAMRDGILSIDRYPDQKSRRFKSYLFPILASLPYVRNAQVARVGEEGRHPSKGLFFRRRDGMGAATHETQGCLSL